MKNMEETQVKLWNDMKNKEQTKLNSDQIWKIQKKIVKW
jgi:hypothetical protein